MRMGVYLVSNGKELSIVEVQVFAPGTNTRSTWYAAHAC